MCITSSFFAILYVLGVFCEDLLSMIHCFWGCQVCSSMFLELHVWCIICWDHVSVGLCLG